MSTNPIQWLKCLVLEHDYEPDRAETDQPLASAPDQTSCTIVEVCQRCGTEDRYPASVEFAERHCIPTVWNADDNDRLDVEVADAR